MTQLIPLDKRSKKAQREYHAKQRGSWYGLNPITRTVQSIRPPVVLVLVGRGHLYQPQLAPQALRVNDKVSNLHSNFLRYIVGGSWPVRRPGDMVTSPCVALSYRRKSLENFTGEIQTKKFTAVPLAAWDGGFMSFLIIIPQQGKSLFG